MTALKSAKICYLLAFPDPAGTAAEPATPIRGLKDAPYFQAVDITVRTLGQAEVEAGGVGISVTRQKYDERIQMVDCRFTLSNVLSAEANQQREAIQKALTGMLVPREHQESGLYEEYVILLVQENNVLPDEFLKKNAAALARFIRSQREVFDKKQMDEILSSRVRYSKNDLTLVDWEGAVVIAVEGDYQSDIELLKVGNYQLLRYRMVDQTLDSSLRLINEQFRANPRLFLPGPTRGQIRRIVQLRLDMMLDFEHTEQNLLLIGDWYTAQLYHAIRDEFYLEEWKRSIKDKLDNLEDIITTIQENFSLTWMGLLERVELIGWIVLLILYFVLFYFQEIVHKP